MKKTVILFVLALTVVMSSVVGAQYNSDNEPLYDSEETVTFIVEMEGSPVLPEMKSAQEKKGGARSINEEAYRGALLRSHKTVTNAINSEISDDIKPQYTYTELFNGFAIEAKYGDLEVIKNTEGVKNVFVSQKIEADFCMSNASSMTHSLPSETMGHTGSGQVVAVIDSDFDVKHVAFSKEPENPKYTKQNIESILSGATFNAVNDVDSVYENGKIPFHFDYGEGDADTYASDGWHGTHLAGIVAGNSPDGDFYGVAPDAQLVLMKIADAKGVMKEATIVAAMDDAAKLGVDVINCSFSTYYEPLNAMDSALATCYENAYNAGIFVVTSAGNKDRGFFDAQTETAYIDDSGAGTPCCIENVFAVGSVDNSINYKRISEITLYDGSVAEACPLNDDYNGTEAIPAGEYVYCKLGYPEDFEGLDLKGKIAVVDRGVLTFMEKSDNAKAAGAIGMILINTYDDYYSSNAELSLPAVCVKSSDGVRIKDAEVKKISSASHFVFKPYEREVGMSYFSSYGTTTNLELKPDISAPGGDINSAWPDGGYSIKSGTSMSAPHISGVVAIINQYLDETGCTAKLSERIDLIWNMLMSTADVVYMKSEDEENKVPYSPRVQGAGIANTANAMKTPVILYADSGKTKLELGDRLSDTIEISFTAENLTGNDVVYDKISAVALTDGYVTQNGKNYISNTRPLQSEWVADFDTVTVPANSSVTVSAQIKLDPEELNENYLIFSNGFYIDGFIRLENSKADVVSVGMPFMGFYGDWTQAPIFDATLYDDGGSVLINMEEEYKGTGLYSTLDGVSFIRGYDEGNNVYRTDTIAISPDGDGRFDTIGLQLTPMRSIKDLTLLVTDEEGNVLTSSNKGIVKKYCMLFYALELPENIPDGTYYVKAEGYLNYDARDSLKQSISIPFKVNRQKPVIKGCTLEGNVLTIDVYDETGIYNTYFMDVTTEKEYNTFYDTYVAEDKVVCVFDENAVPDLSNIWFEVIDNAMNTSACFLGGFNGKILADISEISTDEESYNITFAFTGNDAFSDASLILAFYDEDGSLMHTDTMQNQSVSAGEYAFTGDFDVSTADYCKLFIWEDTKNVTPLDSAKVFDLEMYEIIQK